MPSIPEATLEHYREIQRLKLVALRAGRRAWNRLDGRNLESAWIEQVGLVYPVIAAVEQRAALTGATYSAMTLAQQGTYVPPTEFVDPNTFVGYASDGRPMATLLTVPGYRAGDLLRQGASVVDALKFGVGVLDRILQTQVSDIARQAAGADITARSGVGYVRMLNPPSCDRCSVLASRFYRWNKGFRRHPLCDCVHVPTARKSLAGARAEGLVEDPYKYFSDLSTADQDRLFGKGRAQAIRDGADISQVVNSRRGMTPNGYFTEEGTSRFGNASRGLKPGQRRLTPEAIYEQTERFGHDRDWALDRLKEHGYTLPAGQVPTGALRGQREGYGQLGTGGGSTFGTSSPRRAAQAAIDEARRTGVRDPRSRYTMTAAERRLYDARRRYEVALSGRSPYRSSPGFGNTPDPYGLGLNTGSTRFIAVTPEEIATAEREYRMWLASGGEVFS